MPPNSLTSRNKHEQVHVTRPPGKRRRSAQHKRIHECSRRAKSACQRSTISPAVVSRARWYACPAQRLNPSASPSARAFRADWRCQIVDFRVRRRRAVVVLEHEAVGDSAGAAPGEGPRQACRCLAAQRLSMRLARSSFFSEHQCGADLSRRRSTAAHSRDGPPSRSPLP